MLFLSYALCREMHLQFILGCIVALIIVLYVTTPIRNEAFGMSPGTMDQLSSTRSPTEFFADSSPVKDPNRKPEQAMEDAIQANLAKKALHDMTESTSYPREYAPAF